MRIAAGSASTAHHDSTRPRIAMITRNAAEYDAPRSSAQVVSPTAASGADSGVASTAS